MICIDTHTHLNFQAFKGDYDQVIRRAFDNGVEMLIIGADFKSSERAVKIANMYDKGVYAAVGLHPVHLQGMEFKEEGKRVVTKAEKFDAVRYKKLASSEKVVAIGEIGLEYHHLPKDKTEAHIAMAKQQMVLVEQLKLAHDLNLPIIIHCREARLRPECLGTLASLELRRSGLARQAHSDMLKVLKNTYKRYKGVLHCFSGDWDLMWEYFNLGFLISFNGLITFNSEWDELIRKMPLNKIMIETDCPFMAPVPYRSKRNEPMYVKYVADRIAEIKGVKTEKVAKATTENAKRLFKI